MDGGEGVNPVILEGNDVVVLKGYEYEEDGQTKTVGDLHAIRDGIYVGTAWKPDPEELQRLNAGACVQVMLMTRGPVPPMSVQVLEAPAEQEGSPS